MADLTSNDVQQAVQQGIRNLEADVQRLVTSIANVTNQLQAISNIAQDVQILRQNLQQNLGIQTGAIGFNSAPNMNQVEDKISSIKTDVQSLKSSGSDTGQVDQNIASIQADIQDLKNRFMSLENTLQQLADSQQPQG